MEEIWKDIENYKGSYQVSNLGRFRSFKNNKWGLCKNPKILKLYKRKDNALLVALGGKKFLSHRIVGKTFIPNLENKKEINHIDGDRGNNNIKNLEWCTRSENEIHKYRVLKIKHSMLGKFGKYNHLSKKINQYSKDMTFIKSFDGILEASRTLNISHGNIVSCCLGKRKTAGGFIFKYFNC